MSDLLQRLIDRTRAPLSSLQPILPSIYTPADRTENNTGPMIQAEITESATQPAPFAPRQTEQRESGHSSPPMSDNPAGTRLSPAAPAPPGREPGASPASQQTPGPAPSDQGARLTPPTVEKKTQPPAAPPQVKARLGATGKAKDKGPVTKTFVPQSFGSTVAKSRAKREETDPILGHGTAGIKPDVSPRPSFAKTSEGTEDVGGQAPGATGSLQSPQKKSPDSKAVPPTGHETAARISPVKTMPSLAATMKWIGATTPPAIERPAPARTIETDRGGSPDSSNESSIGSASVPHRSEGASPRENKNARIEMPVNKEVFSTRQSESPARNVSRGRDRVPPVEVNVAIGHIEVKSVQPNPPAPRKPPQRPRFTLEEFLKNPHSGGLR
jgi:hypothetical protein